MTDRPLLVVINPNTDSTVTAFMAKIVAATVGNAIRVDGRTAVSGPPLITNEETLTRAVDEVLHAGQIAATDGAAAILVSAFGDPGVAALRHCISIPVTGIAEASMAEAANGGRRFSIVTTTPLLKNAIAGFAAANGYGSQLAAVRITPGDAEATMADHDRLATALLALCRRTIAEDGVEAIIIGGGPLALAARAIEKDIAVPLIEPVSAGARLAASRILRVSP